MPVVAAARLHEPGVEQVPDAPLVNTNEPVPPEKVSVWLATSARFQHVGDTATGTGVASVTDANAAGVQPRR